MGKKTLIFILIFGIIFLTALLAGANVYRTAMDQKESGHEQAAETAKQEAGLKQVDSVETFVGKEKQYIVTGTDKKAAKCMFGCLLTKSRKRFTKKRQTALPAARLQKRFRMKALCLSLKRCTLQGKAMFIIVGSYILK